MKGSKLMKSKPTNQSSGLPIHASHVMVCVDEIREGVICGRAINAFVSKPIYFTGLDNLFLQLEFLYDSLQVPQPPNIRRFERKSQALGSVTDFPEVTTFWNPQKTKGCRGKLATVLVRVMYRQNASWQGQAIWVEGKKQVQCFRSALELLHLFQNVLSMLLEEQTHASRATS